MREQLMDTFSGDNPRPHFMLEVSVPGPYGFTTVAQCGGMTQEEAVNPPAVPRMTDFQNRINSAWHSARDGWSNAESYQALVRNIVEPEVGTLTYPISKLAEVARWLSTQIGVDAGWVTPDADSPTWLRNLESGWPQTSNASHSFFEFWTDVDDKCGHYLRIAEYLTEACGQTAAAVYHFQDQLREFLLELRQALITTLTQWQEWEGPEGMWPTGEVREVDAYTYGGIGASIVGLFPVAPWLAVGSASAGILLGVASLAGLPKPSFEVLESSEADSVSTIDSRLRRHLRETESGLAVVLDELRSHTRSVGEDQFSNDVSAGSLQTFVSTAVASSREWQPLEVDLS